MHRNKTLLFENRDLLLFIVSKLHLLLSKHPSYVMVWAKLCFNEIYSFFSFESELIS